MDTAHKGKSVILFPGSYSFQLFSSNFASAIAIVLSLCLNFLLAVSESLEMGIGIPDLKNLSIWRIETVEFSFFS